MYPSLLFLHSWVRWFALGAVVLVFLRGLRGMATTAPWTKSDSAWIKGAAHLMTTQAVIGILLYAVSPYIRSLLDTMSTTMKEPGSRLFAVEHEVVMILAVGCAHMGSALARKATSDKTRHTRAAIFFGVALVLIGYGMPWARPFFRVGM